MVCIGVKNSNKRDDICHGQAGVSVPALSESFPWQQENGIFLLCLILLLVFPFSSFSFFFFFFVVLKCIFYCYDPRFLYSQRGNTLYIKPRIYFK